MTLKRTFIFLMLLSLWGATSAKVKVTAHLNFGKTGNISFVSAPSEVYSSDSKIKLKSMGDPVFNAEAPMGKALKGDGCILFHGNGDGYTGTQAIGKASDNMILEVWVKARTHTHGETHKRDIDRIRPVVTNGVLGEGYSIAQKGKKWVFVGGKSGNVDIGDVILDQWVHLAAVRDGDSGTVWRDGKHTNNFTPSTSYGDGFSIAASTTSKYPSYFNGDIYEIRYSIFKKGAFDPESDFLLYYEKKKEKSQARTAARAELVKILESDGLGKELVTTLSTALCKKDWLIE
ncbi:MAG: LamG-like jellyroll fold domain-containing protein, partial [Candidatus Theseobacter exili]|nr:LamG-like jellyroll fold domain-containing protein [Candidatus Theseobacter exili]